MLFSIVNAFVKKSAEKYWSLRVYTIIGNRITNQHKYKRKFLIINFLRMVACVASETLYNLLKINLEEIMKNMGTAIRNHGYNIMGYSTE